MSAHMTGAQATYKLGAPCPNCGCGDSEWNVGADLSSDRNRAFTVAYLACTDCSETLTVRDQDWIEDVLNSSQQVWRALAQTEANQEES